MRSPLRLLNLQGELFASTLTYGLNATIKLGSSLVLTRLLSPQAFGIFGILFPFLFMIELLSDVGSVGLLVRHPRGGERKFVHTVWTVRLIRSCVNFCLLFAAAPLIAQLYRTPVLTSAFRALSLWFLISGAESMSFVLAQRDRRARIGNYAELSTQVFSTVAVIAMASVLKNHLALIYGSLLQRALLAIGSHLFYRDIGVGIAFDREALKDQFQFARFVLPSSILTIVISQYDKLIFPKLFDLSLLGIYGVASSMMAPIAGVIVHNARVVLYARAADYFRTDRASAVYRYYEENRRLLVLGVILPSLLAGFSQSIVAVLYDPRYAPAGHVLLVTGLGTIVTSFQNASENLLVASGPNHIVLVANIVRLCSVVPAALLGYYWFGFDGFLWLNAAATLPPMLYYYREQARYGLLNTKSELRLLLLALAVFLVAAALSRLLLLYLPTQWLHLGLKRH